MAEYYYSGDLAGIKLHFVFRHAETAKYFGSVLRPSAAVMGAVRVPVSDCLCWFRDYGMADNGNTEFGMSVYRASDALAPFGRSVFHAAAFQWRGRSYLLAADSGVGKSTQLRHWLSLYGEEIRVMNGDKPIICLTSDDCLTVFPSPWKGKEEWGDDSLSAPLGGVILLRQGGENKIERLSPALCSARLLSLIFSTFENKDTLHAHCSVLDAMLRRVPIWRLTNLGDLASAKLTHDTILQEEAGV